MRRLKQIWAWSCKDVVRRRFLLGVVALGANSLRLLLEENHERLDALEERGLVPIDDLATVGDLGKLEGRINRLESIPVPTSTPTYHDPPPPAAMGEATD